MVFKHNGCLWLFNNYIIPTYKPVAPIEFPQTQQGTMKMDPVMLYILSAVVGSVSGLFLCHW
jgi:hypothetical protein